METAQKDCDAAKPGMIKPKNIPILIKFTTYGLQWVLPERRDDRQMDATSLLKCLDPEKTATLPSEVFGSFRSPFDVKEMYFGQNGGISVLS